MDHEAGSELDADVATKVMGLSGEFVAPYSTEMAAAWAVVVHMRTKLFSVRQLFALNLAHVISARIWPDGSNRIDPSQVMLHVEPVDIAIAALVALGREE